ncbi:MAG: hypothetical protein JWO56_258 [Acidobacteria bacterium]|jgi:hypothetical protein|nr:hypothetical protein [Acidobacteriota bacterium]
MLKHSPDTAECFDRHAGPSLLPVAIVHVLLFLAGLLAVTAFAGGDRFPSPFEPEEVIRRFFLVHAAQVRVQAFFLFGAAVPLGIFTATAVSRLRFLGVRAAGELIALYGGFGASLALAASGLGSWVLSILGTKGGVGDIVQTLHLLTFAAGGPAAVVLLGLFLAGVSVSGGLASLIPRWVMWLGLTVALVAEFSSLLLLFPRLASLLPLARFPSLVWLIAVGATLPRSRRTMLPEPV